MASEGLKPKVYLENITGIYNSHVTTTSAYALQIANKMNKKYKTFQDALLVNINNN